MNSPVRSLVRKQRGGAPSASQDVAIAVVLALVSSFLSVEPSIANALVRVALWAIFLIYVVKTPFLWQPGPSSWFVIMQVLSFGSWTVFYITGALFFGDTGSFLAVVGGRDASLGFRVDTGSFVFLTIAWSIVRILGPWELFCEQPRLVISPTQLNATPRACTARLLAAGAVGMVAGIFCSYLPGSLVQPMLLLFTFFAASTAALVLMADDREPIGIRFRWPLTLTLAYGIVAFAGSGLKGALFLALFQLAWYIGGVKRELRRKMALGSGCLFCLFIVLLPAFQDAKDTYERTKSRDETIGTLVQGVNGLFSGHDAFADFRSKPFAEATWEYLGMRLCMSSMTWKYLERYGDAPLGSETILTALQTAVPRILDRNKISSSEYYDNLARVSGIGNFEDTTTSRKPSFMDESVIVWGEWGFIVGGIVFGAYLVLLERLAGSIAKDHAMRSVVRFTWITLGQLPYIAVIVGGNSYVILFTAFVMTPLYRYLWLPAVPVSKRPKAWTPSSSTS